MMNNKIKILVIITASMFFTACSDLFEFELPEEGSIADLSSPNAFFTAQRNGDVDYGVTFTNLSSEALYYTWSLGDGEELETLASDEQPWFDYTFDTDVEKEYTITLTATDGNNKSSVYSEVFYATEGDSEYRRVDDNIVVNSFSSFQNEGDDKYHPAFHSIDGDMDTEWTAQDGDIIAGDYKGDGEYVIYDLGVSTDINLVELSVIGKLESYGYEIYVSNSSDLTEDSFTKLMPESTDISFTSQVVDEDSEDIILTESLEVSGNARYVKLVVYGRFEDIDTAMPSRSSAWSNISEITFSKLR